MTKRGRATLQLLTIGRNNSRVTITWISSVCFSRSCVAIVVKLLLLASVAGCNASKEPRDNPAVEQPLEPAMALHAAFRAKQWKEARAHGLKALAVSPNDPDLLHYTAVASAMSGLKSEAASLLADAAKAADFKPPSRVDHAVQALIDVGDVYSAIELLEQSLQVHPNRGEHRRTLVGFLGEVQRPDLVTPHYQRLVQDREFKLAFLTGFTDMSKRRHVMQNIESIMERNPDDHRIGLGRAQSLIDDRNIEAAEKALRKILEHHPRFAPAHALLGQVLIADAREGEIPEWAKTQCPDSREFSNHWLTLGDWASHQNLNIEAARAYWEATRRDSNDAQAWSRLVDSLRRIQASRQSDFRTDDVADESTAESSLRYATSKDVIEDCDQRFRNLVDLRKHLERFSGRDEKSQGVALLIAQTLHRLGRDWEAEAWSAVATTLPEDKTDELSTFRRQIIDALRENRDWESTRGHPAQKMDLSRLPLPDPNVGDSASTKINLVVLPDSDDIGHFDLDDETAVRGLVVPYRIVRPTSPSLIHAMGAGGAALDIDLDGWTDLMIAGAGGALRNRNSAPNICLRNMDGEFVDVTDDTGTGDTGFCQGIAVGDFNEDGFPDVFLANLGENRLLRNNGDGTFTEATDALAGDARQWTTCGAFVDLDQDGITDLVAVNYCDADTPIDQPCFEKEKPVVCDPVRFPAHADQLLKGLGNGRFQDVTSQWLREVPKGRGLGVLAGALDGRSVGALVVNDMSTNQYYSHGESDEEIIQESATVRGVAVDARSHSQASMGIASGDFDGDGDLDIYVTGFALEYNIYYRQESPGFWRDDTARQGLLRPSLMSVGFGTEAIDMDGDGIDELLVTNGHIRDFGADNPPPHAQQFQLFRRNSSGRFASVDVSDWCSYLATPHIGRALWTLDVDRDGRTDMVITHEDEPPRLLVNRTNSDHERLALRLVGSRDSRDATGAIVRFECDGRQRVLWSLSGDGYMCSNERVLRAGLGNGERVENLTVSWPDGSVDHIGTLDGNSEYVIVQGSGQAFLTH